MKYILDLRFVKLFAYICAKYIQINMNKSHKHRYVYYYGFQIIYGAINKGLLLIVSSLLLGIFPTTMLVTASFVSTRVFAGGLHFKSYTLCAYVSLGSLLLMGFCAKHVPYCHMTNILVFSTILAVFYMYSPVENINRPLKINEIKIYKIISVSILLFLWLVQSIIPYNIVKQSFTFGVLLSGVITLPIINNLVKKANL